MTPEVGRTEGLVAPVTRNLSEKEAEPAEDPDLPQWADLPYSVQGLMRLASSVLGFGINLVY